jgi:diguanylate cyclase (GGDEF)-like protein
MFCIGLLAAVDISNHNEYFLSFFYLVPIALTSWLSGKPYGIALAVLGTAILIVEKLPDNTLALAWNTLSTLSVFVTVTFLVDSFKKLRETERQLSRSDHVTGVLSQRAFSELVGYELLRLRRNIVPFSVGFIDLDNSSATMAGRNNEDELLKTVADCLVKQLRRTDLVARINEDEFVVYFPATDEVAVQVPVQKVWQRLVPAVQQLDRSVTLNVGVVTCHYPPDGLEELISYADAFMHEVKKSGKESVRYTVFAET